MSSSTLNGTGISTGTGTGTGRVQVGDDGVMDSSHPRAGGPARRRSFTPTQKLEHLGAYESACEAQEGGAYLRREGLYSSHLIEWRRACDVGALAGLDAPSRRGQRSAERVELDRLRRDNARVQAELARAKAALEVVGKAHALLETISESAEPGNGSMK